MPSMDVNLFFRFSTLSLICQNQYNSLSFLQKAFLFYKQIVKSVKTEKLKMACIELNEKIGPEGNIKLHSTFLVLKVIIF
jgi:hypothetical protein